jgi:hypothetical protein
LLREYVGEFCLELVVRRPIVSLAKVCTPHTIAKAIGNTILGDQQKDILKRKMPMGWYRQTVHKVGDILIKLS